MDEEKEDRGFRTIGSLMPQTLRSLAEKVSMRERSQTNLPTTGAPGPGPGESSSTGRPRSATGAVASRGNMPGLTDPAATDIAIVASLPPSVRSALQETVREYLDPAYGYDFEVVAYTIGAELMPRDQMLAVRIVEGACAPANPKVIASEVARLRASTKARSEANDDLAMTFQVLVEECEEYPADVVVWALRSWARREIFFPSLAELRDELQRKSRRRLRLLDALRYGPDDGVAAARQAERDAVVAAGRVERDRPKGGWGDI